MKGNPSVLVQSGWTSWLRFRDPEEVMEARTSAEVGPLLTEADDAVGAGRYVAGFLTYEAAPAFDHAFRTLPPGPLLPLAWFAIYRDVERFEGTPCCADAFTVGEWTASMVERDYREALRRIRGYIKAGDTYQVNYTMRLSAAFEGSPEGLFLRLCGAQKGRNAGMVVTPEWAVCSASPELFFSLDGDRLVCRPMKGTAARGLTQESDMAAADALHKSAKDRAENVMIVDMMRNDMGRCAAPGSVVVASAFDVERYPTVLQMTSTVEARTNAGLREIMTALFPCASVTGAPKVRTMEIIRDLECGPRGVYTGAIGYAGPGRKAQFNVAIRTVSIDRRAGRAEYGVGGGIVWDSEAADEYRECLTKSRILSDSPPEFRLLETMRWSGAGGYELLGPHMDRMAASAGYFGYRFDRGAAERVLAERAAVFAAGERRVRLLLDRDGTFACEDSLLEGRTPGAFACVRPAVGAVSSSDVFLYHKTTYRDVYRRAAEMFPDADDVLLFNERGELTESTVANVVVDFGRQRVTPPVSCGLLAGTLRRKLLEDGAVVERVLKLGDLRRADRIWLVNSVRGEVPAQLLW